MPFPVLTYSSADAADWMGAPSERWLIHKLRAGAFPGRKVGRNWRMTEQDITDALDVCANDIRRIPTSSHFRVDGQPVAIVRFRQPQHSASRGMPPPLRSVHDVATTAN